MAKDINLGSVGGLQDTINIIRQLLSRVLHLIQSVNNRNPMQLTIAERKDTVALGDKSRGHVEPVVNRIGGKAMHQHQRAGVEYRWLAVPVIEPGTGAFDKGGGVRVGGDGFVDDGAGLADWDWGCLDDG